MSEMKPHLDQYEIRNIEAEENLIIDAQFLVQEIMTEKKLTQADLARAMGVSKARLSQMMGANCNFTIRTMARIFAAMDEQLVLARKPRREEAVACRGGAKQQVAAVRYAMSDNVLERFSWTIEELSPSCCNDYEPGVRIDELEAA